MITLKWKPLCEDIEDIVTPIADFLKPSSFKDLDNLFHGKDKYCFLPDFSKYVDKGREFFNECKIELTNYFFGNVSNANTNLHEYLLGQTPDVFMPFMQNVLNPGVDINISNLYNPNNVDNVSLDNIWQTFGFNGQEQIPSNLENFTEAISMPDVLSIPTEQSEGFFQAVGDTISNVAESIKDAVVNIDWGDVADKGAEVLGWIGSFFGF